MCPAVSCSGKERLNFGLGIQLIIRLIFLTVFTCMYSLSPERSLPQVLQADTDTCGWCRKVTRKANCTLGLWNFAHCRIIWQNFYEWKLNGLATIQYSGSFNLTPCLSQMFAFHIELLCCLTFSEICSTFLCIGYLFILTYLPQTAAWHLFALLENNKIMWCQFSDSLNKFFVPPNNLKNYMIQWPLVHWHSVYWTFT